MSADQMSTFLSGFCCACVTSPYCCQWRCDRPVSHAGSGSSVKQIYLTMTDGRHRTHGRQTDGLTS